ncbi:hypothetical protein [Galbibacter orientalis]|uniref:Uncharacterized protein n=1 Tax=Galbibacter orientalis DSM 19592 TaxID=926559 RepID=I3C3B0_9FLAO|nr:hypothetical protein [Galbibacter orientalis]EIJ38103.1 hypothetical protein JoomaDRAFT_1083 [Galbibacter orientalis DSM 19592]
MVKVIDFKTRTNDEGEEFNVLIVQGGAEPIRSQQTGKLYITAKTASVPSTFDADTCKSLIGTSFEGSVKRVECEPFDYVMQETGEVIELSHRYELVNEEMEILEEQTLPTEVVR